MPKTVSSFYIIIYSFCLIIVKQKVILRWRFLGHFYNHKKEKVLYKKKDERKINNATK